jgi:hypothetical protein
MTNIYSKNILVISSFGFLLPILFTRDIFFIIILYFASLISALFWCEAKNKSLIHYADGIMARISIVSIIFYKLFINTNNLLLFVISTSTALYYTYISNINSRIEWKSKKHILNHFVSHILLSISGIIAFIEPLSFTTL